jgi:hypothetical protein
MKYTGALGAMVALLAAGAYAAGVTGTETNNGNLLMEDAPPIPAEIFDDLNRYQNVRGANFAGWQQDGSGVSISTRFTNVDQLHRVDMPGGARHQLTYFGEPVGSITPQPHGDGVVFTRDAGGREFSQIFLLEPVTGVATMLTDGESRNDAHGYRKTENRDIYQQATVLFLQRYLVGGE